MTRIVNIQRVVIERRQRAGNTTHDCHWMWVATESVEQTGNLLVDHGMTGHRSFKFVILFLSRFFTIQQDVTNFQVVRIGRQLIDRETAVQQNTFITINKSNFRFAGCGWSEARVKGEHTFWTESTDINNILTQRAFQHIQFNSCVPVEGEFCFCISHLRSP